MNENFKICPVCNHKMETLWLTDYDVAISQYYLKGWKCNKGCGSDFFWKTEDKLQSFKPEGSQESPASKTTNKSSKDYSEAKFCPICKEKLLVLSSVNHKRPGYLNLLGWDCTTCMNHFPKDAFNKLEKYIHPNSNYGEMAENSDDSGVLNEIPKSLSTRGKKTKNKGKNTDNPIRVKSIDELLDIMALNDILNAATPVDIETLLEERSAEVLKGLNLEQDIPDKEVKNPWCGTSLFASL